MKDLDKIHILAKAEVGFFKFIVIPLWTLMNNFLEGELQESVKNLNDSVENWNKIFEENKPKENPVP